MCVCVHHTLFLLLAYCTPGAEPGQRRLWLASAHRFPGMFNGWDKTDSEPPEHLVSAQYQLTGPGTCRRRGGSTRRRPHWHLTDRPRTRLSVPALSRAVVGCLGRRWSSGWYDQMLQWRHQNIGDGPKPGLVLGPNHQNKAIAPPWAIQFTLRR